ncbi:MAG: FAD-binding protein [Acidobacteria bacterium]|nr:FAD-binding protein [Acidobacteriota bacterium]
MPIDPTLTLGLGNITQESRRLAAAVTPRTGRWDVIVVGSGAAGGMAAFQLATAGIKVLLLEAGRMIDTQKEYRTMEWPYASGRRQRLPPDERAIAVAEYNFLDRPYGNNPQFEKYRKLGSYAGNTFTRNWVVNEKEQPTTGTPYAGVRARILGGRTNFWGRGALRYGQISHAVHGTGPLRPRMRSPGLLPLAYRADLPRPRYRKPHGSAVLHRG